MSRRLTLVVLAVALAAFAVPPVLAQDDDLHGELTEVQGRIEDLSSEISSAAENRSALAGEVVATETRMNGLVAKLSAAQAEMAVVSGELRDQQIRLLEVQNALRDVQIQLEQTRSDLAQSEEDARNWARQLYMSAGQDKFAFAAGAGHVSEIAVGFEYLDRMSVATDRMILTFEALQKQEQSQVERVTEREKEVVGEVDKLAEVEDELADVEEELAAQRAAVADELTHQQGLLGEVDTQISHFESELDALEAEQSRIEEAINAEQATLARDGGGGDGISTGVFVRPVPGRISSGFGPRTHPILGYRRMHTGLDMSAGYGEEIRAADGGTVIMAGSYGGYGTAVVIDHGGGVATLYAHQSKLGVSYGQQVGRGDVVGYIGSTGLSTGPHLHFEVRINGTPVDPAPYL